MWEPSSANATSQPQSRPASPTVPAADERNDEAAGDESAPLLQPQTTSPDQAVSAKFIHFLTSLGISSSFLTLVLIIANEIVMAIVGYGYQVPWATSEAIHSVVIPVRRHEYPIYVSRLIWVGSIFNIHLCRQSRSYPKEAPAGSTCC